MGNKNLNYEEYPAVGDFLLASLKADQAKFQGKYKTMDAAYLSGFEAAINDVRGLASIFAQTQGLKLVTANLYTIADEVRGELLFLKDYLREAGLDYGFVSGIRDKLDHRNIEGGVKALRDMLPYLNDHLAALESGDMPEDFLNFFEPKLVEMEHLNAEQNEIINTRAGNVKENLRKFAVLQSYFSKICNNGKKLFTTEPKKSEYTMSALITRVRNTGNHGVQPPAAE